MNHALLGEIVRPTQPPQPRTVKFCFDNLHIYAGFRCPVAFSVFFLSFSSAMQGNLVYFCSVSLKECGCLTSNHPLAALEDLQSKSLFLSSTARCPIWVAITWAACLSLFPQVPYVQEESDYRFPLAHHHLLRSKLPGCLQQQRSDWRVLSNYCRANCLRCKTSQENLYMYGWMETLLPPRGASFQ